MELTLLPNLKQATADDIMELNDALEVLAKEDPDLVELVELKFFVGHNLTQRRKAAKKDHFKTLRLSAFA